MTDKTDLPIIEDTPKKVSRRDFIIGVIAGGAAVSSGYYLFRAAMRQGQRSTAGVRERLITLNVNGQQRRVDVMSQETLAATLRYKLGLTGTKLGCDRAECGSCTVLIDDVPHYSCSVLTHTVRGRKVVTIEGLAGADGTLHPIQQGVIDEQGFQCAFCMPGTPGCRRGSGSRCCWKYRRWRRGWRVVGRIGNPSYNPSKYRRRSWRWSWCRRRLPIR